MRRRRDKLASNQSSSTGHRGTRAIAFQIAQLLVLFQRIYFRFVTVLGLEHLGCPVSPMPML